jgi:hypothetical protein
MKLPIVHLTLTVEFDRPFFKPDYAGSLLRGQFGRMLKKRTCLTGTYDCASCAVADSCLAVRLFDAPGSNIPAPYVIRDLSLGALRIEPATPWQFRHTLLGKQAIAQAPLVTQIWQNVFESGFGKQRIKGRLIEVRDSFGNIASQHNGGRLVNLAKAQPLQMIEPENVPWHITLATPLRLFFNRRQIRPADFRPEHFFKAVWHRLQALRHSPYGFEALTLDEHDRQALFGATLEIENLGWRKWRRYSTRQNNSQNMDGIIGQLRLIAAEKRARQLVWLAQQVHIGKNTTLGLGAYETTHSHRL